MCQIHDVPNSLATPGCTSCNANSLFERDPNHNFVADRCIFLVSPPNTSPRSVKTTDCGITSWSWRYFQARPVRAIPICHRLRVFSLTDANFDLAPSGLENHRRAVGSIAGRVALEQSCGKYEIAVGTEDSAWAGGWSDAVLRNVLFSRESDPIVYWNWNGREYFWLALASGNRQQLWENGIRCDCSFNPLLVSDDSITNCVQTAYTSLRQNSSSTSTW